MRVCMSVCMRVHACVLCIYGGERMWDKCVKKGIWLALHFPFDSVARVTSSIRGWHHQYPGDWLLIHQTPTVGEWGCLCSSVCVQSGSIPTHPLPLPYMFLMNTDFKKYDNHCIILVECHFNVLQAVLFLTSIMSTSLVCWCLEQLVLTGLRSARHHAMLHLLSLMAYDTWNRAQVQHQWTSTDVSEAWRVVLFHREDFNHSPL